MAHISPPRVEVNSVVWDLLGNPCNARMHTTRKADMPMPCEHVHGLHKLVIACLCEAPRQANTRKSQMWSHQGFPEGKTVQTLGSQSNF